MSNDRFKELTKEGHHRGEHQRGERHRGRGDSRLHGPKTFRRGRALAFLEMLNLKRSTLKQQLDQPEFDQFVPF